MSVFTSHVTQVLTLAEGAITIRKLAPKHLAAAMRAAQAASLAGVREMGGIGVLKEMADLDDKDAKKDGPKPAINPLVLYDVVTLLEKGIVEWSYETKLSRESIEDLDAETQELLAREILQLTKPALFEAYDAEQARKNAAAPSTVH